MNTVDILVLVVLVLNGAIGAARGFVWQAFRVGSLVLALWLGHRFAAPLADGPLSALTGLDATGRRVIAYVGILVAVYAAMHLIGHWIRRLIDKARLTSTDRALGFLLGGLKGAFFVVLTFQILFVFFAVLPDDIQSQLVGGKDGNPPASQAFILHRNLVAKQLSGMMPEDLREDIIQGVARSAR